MKKMRSTENLRDWEIFKPEQNPIFPSCHLDYLGVDDALTATARDRVEAGRNVSLVARLIDGSNIATEANSNVAIRYRGKMSGVVSETNERNHKQSTQKGRWTDRLPIKFLPRVRDPSHRRNKDYKDTL